MSDYAVFEEPKPTHAEFSCQTEEIALGEVEAQTVEETISGYQKSEEDPEIAFWETVVANRRKEVKRMWNINDEMHTEKAEKMRKLEEKQTEYKRLFDEGNEKLNKSRKEEVEGEDEIALEEVEAQTVEETISGYQKSEEDPEIAFWEAVVANRRIEVKRMWNINDKMHTEKAEKMRKLEEKQIEYKRLFDEGNEKLNMAREQEVEGEDDSVEGEVEKTTTN